MTEPAAPPVQLPAGDLSSWLRRTRLALEGDDTADVPCGDCIACCTSSHFVHIGPEESRTLARIPGELLFAAPGSPEGTVLLGYDPHGRCPMLRAGVCSIYEDRPLTCRTCDCRVFAAAGIAADRAAITQQARRWTFSHPEQEDRDRHDAVRAAAAFVKEHAECFPGGDVPKDPAQIAILAIKVYEVFLDHGEEPSETRPARAPSETAKAVVEAGRRFEVTRDARRHQQR